MQRHDLQGKFADELDRLRQTFDRERTREERLAAAWEQRAGDVAEPARRAAVLAALLRDGFVTKSTYSRLCGVSPATASKHLGALAERGLLQQTGKGPSTRYLLEE
jgi:Fic family protein